MSRGPWKKKLEAGPAPKRRVDVVIPSLRKPHLALCEMSLENLPFDYDLHVISDVQGWPQAVNAGLAKTKGDVVLLDDDIIMLPQTFENFEAFYDKADIFGFKLFFPDGSIQHAGGIFRDGQIRHIGFRDQDRPEYGVPRYVCHATTSLVYIKRSALDKLVGMAVDYPGVQFEDVDFSYRALKAGLKILQLPSPAIHYESFTKKQSFTFESKMRLNAQEIFKRYHADHNFAKVLESYPKALA